MELAAYIILYILIFFMGASVFSFLNVVVYRLPRKIPVHKGSSFCPSCKNKIMLYDMIPVINRIYLRGKCRSCGAPIAVRYQLVELFGGLCAVFFCAYYDAILGNGALKALTAFFVCAVLTAVTLIDADTMEIPDVMHIALAAAAILSLAAFPQIRILERVIGMLSVSVPMLILTLIIPGAFGGGDIKLMIPAGFLLGWKLTLVAFFIAIIIGGVQGIFLLLSKKIEKRGHFAFGPALCAGIMVSLLAGERLLGWYLSLMK